VSLHDSSDLRLSDLLATAASSLAEIDGYRGHPDDPDNAEEEIVSDILWALWDLHDVLTQGLSKVDEGQVTAYPDEAQAMNDLLTGIYDASFYGEKRGLTWVKARVAALRSQAEQFNYVQQHRASIPSRVE